LLRRQRLEEHVHLTGFRQHRGGGEGGVVRRGDEFLRNRRLRFRATVQRSDEASPVESGVRGGAAR
jgi:hypothetical protein